jgi:hypothetical protein
VRDRKRKKLESEGSSSNDDQNNQKDARGFLKA